MSALAIVDTNIVLNLLNVPHHCAERCAVKDEFDRFNTSNYSFLLPIAAIIETGNHIADIPDGRQRRKYAEIFVGQVREVFDGAAPWRPTDFLTKAEMAGWLATFDAIILDPIITEPIFRSMLDLSGVMIGLGQYRPQAPTGGSNGRFIVDSLKWKDQRQLEIAA